MTTGPPLPEGDTQTVITHRRDVLMIRRIAVVLTGLLATGLLATGVAAAAPADGHQQDSSYPCGTTSRSRSERDFASPHEVLDMLFGGGLAGRDRF